MKKIMFTALVVSSIAHAGFWGSVVGGAIGSNAGGSSSSHQTTVQQIAAQKTRMNKINTYLWNMHKSGKYTKDYKFYLDYLEQSEDITDLDTVAWVYKDNGNKVKAIEIYKKRIFPWLKIENAKTQAKYQRYFDQISDKVPVVSKKNKKLTTKQKCLQSGGKWSWSSTANKWQCVK